METAEIVAPGTTPEVWPELQELRGDRLSSIPPSELEHAFVHAFRGVVPERQAVPRRRDHRRAVRPRHSRPRPARRRPGLGHGAARPPRRRQPRDPLPRADRRTDVPRPLRAGTRLRQRPRRRRRVDRPRRQRQPVRPRPSASTRRRRWRATGSATAAPEQSTRARGAGDAGPVDRSCADLRRATCPRSSTSCRTPA